jgi:hypothetical protein
MNGLIVVYSNLRKCMAMGEVLPFCVKHGPEAMELMVTVF